MVIPITLEANDTFSLDILEGFDGSFRQSIRLWMKVGTKFHLGSKFTLDCSSKVISKLGTPLPKMINKGAACILIISLTYNLAYSSVE